MRRQRLLLGEPAWRSRQPGLAWQWCWLMVLLSSQPTRPRQQSTAGIDRLTTTPYRNVGRVSAPPRRPQASAGRPSRPGGGARTGGTVALRLALACLERGWRRLLQLQPDGVPCYCDVDTSASSQMTGVLVDNNNPGRPQPQNASRPEAGAHSGSRSLRRHSALVASARACRSYDCTHRSWGWARLPRRDWPAPRPAAESPKSPGSPLSSPPTTVRFLSRRVPM